MEAFHICMNRSVENRRKRRLVRESAGCRACCIPKLVEYFTQTNYIWKELTSVAGIWEVAKDMNVKVHSLH